ncbi:universal stress protein [Mycetocola spongiae]|uniref:universal stress protein n=1 Tax=Mycetocola spongiae TaxID=2859226 RepID=UPI001CF3F5F6|nr:universal stress protein [Mycetocola spongiae]UCR89657.1 universal stress protein [Mycetocola spongiae]
MTAFAGTAIPRLVIGVMPGQAAVVIDTALGAAAAMNARAIFAYVQRGSALIEQADFSARDSLSLSPEADEESGRILAGLRAYIAARPDAARVDWKLVELGGDPVRALDRLAEAEDAAMIVMGGVRRGFAHRAEDLIGGSPATWLARHQLRPVLVVPDDRGPRIDPERPEATPEETTS